MRKYFFLITLSWYVLTSSVILFFMITQKSTSKAAGFFEFKEYCSDSDIRNWIIANPNNVVAILENIQKHKQQENNITKSDFEVEKLGSISNHQQVSVPVKEYSRYKVFSYNSSDSKNNSKALPYEKEHENKSEIQESNISVEVGLDAKRNEEKNSDILTPVEVESNIETVLERPINQGRVGIAGNPAEFPDNFETSLESPLNKERIGRGGKPAELKSDVTTLKSLVDRGRLGEEESPPDFKNNMGTVLESPVDQERLGKERLSVEINNNFETTLKRLIDRERHGEKGKPVQLDNDYEKASKRQIERGKLGEQEKPAELKSNSKTGSKPAAVRNHTLGEMGKPAQLNNLSDAQIIEANTLWEKYAFNAYLSQKISLHRSLPDLREDKCKEPGRYSDDLPSTSIIICFHNEDWSVLLRLVHSILSRTKKQLLQEIILVDDFSNFQYLHKQLYKYLSSVDKVKVIHTEDRLGLVKARMLGAKEAQGQVLTFLDSHCEVTEGWIEPLLQTVKNNRSTAAVPLIEQISTNDFHITSTPCEYISIGGFTWALHYNWHLVPIEDRVNRHPCDNVRSPTMAGGLFSIDAKYFKEIGLYDENMEVWGGENLGLSFKLWMCGGRIEMVPCSHVGHIFRNFMPEGVETAKKYGGYIYRNFARVAETWLDEYKPFFYKYWKDGEYVNVDKELELRSKLQCKSFGWYLKNIYPEKFVFDKTIAFGELKSLAYVNVCLDIASKQGRLTLENCHGRGGFQVWFHTSQGEIRNDELCLNLNSKKKVTARKCHGNGSNQLWVYNSMTQQVQHRSSPRCLVASPSNKTVAASKCSNDVHAKWQFSD